MYSGTQTDEIYWPYITGKKEGTVTDHYQAHLRGKTAVGRATATPCGHEST